MHQSNANVHRHGRSCQRLLDTGNWILNSGGSEHLPATGLSLEADSIEIFSVPAASVARLSHVLRRGGFESEKTRALQSVLAERPDHAG